MERRLAYRAVRVNEQNLSKKERLGAYCASRWSAVGCMNCTTKKNGLTRAGLLMEVARNPPGIPKFTLFDAPEAFAE